MFLYLTFVQKLIHNGYTCPKEKNNGNMRNSMYADHAWRRNESPMQTLQTPVCEVCTIGYKSYSVGRATLPDFLEFFSPYLRTHSRMNYSDTSRGARREGWSRRNRVGAKSFFWSRRIEREKFSGIFQTFPDVSWKNYPERSRKIPVNDQFRIDRSRIL